MVGYGVLFLAVSRGAVARAAVLDARSRSPPPRRSLVVLPVLPPLLSICSATRASRGSLDDARAVLGDAAELPRVVRRTRTAGCSTLARRLGWRMGEVLFPGVLAIVLGAAGAALASRATRRRGRRRDRETVLLYGSLGLLAFWASFGPAAGLYTACSSAFPLFSFLRAPSRFGLVVVAVLAVLVGDRAAAPSAPAGRPRRALAARPSLALLRSRS